MSGPGKVSPGSWGTGWSGEEMRPGARGLPWESASRPHLPREDAKRPCRPGWQGEGRGTGGATLNVSSCPHRIVKRPRSRPSPGSWDSPCSSALRAGVLSCHLGEGSPSTGRRTVHLGLPQSNAVAQLQGLLPLGVNWQSLETFLVVTRGGWYCWHLVGRGQGRC